MNMRRLGWYLKQLWPFAYLSTFTEDGRRRLCVWKMWLGRCFRIRYFNLSPTE